MVMGCPTMNTLDTIIDTLANGEWLSVNELSTKAELKKLSMTTLTLALKLLADYGFIELRETWTGNPPIPHTEANLHPTIQTFLRKIRWIERAGKKT